MTGTSFKCLVALCLYRRHDILEDLRTPSRDHLKWPEVSSFKQKDPKSSGTPQPNLQTMTQASPLTQKRKYENMHKASCFDQRFVKMPVLNQNLETRFKPSPLQQNHLKGPKDSLLKPKTPDRGVDGTQCFLSVGQTRQKTPEGKSDRTDQLLRRGQKQHSITEKDLGAAKQSLRGNEKQQKSSEYKVDVSQHFPVGQRLKQSSWGQDAFTHIPYEQKDTAMRDRATPAVQGPTVVRSFGLPKKMEPIKKVEEVRPPVKKILISREMQHSR